MPYEYPFQDVQILKTKEEVDESIEACAREIHDHFRNRGRNHYKEAISVIPIMRGGMVYASRLLPHLRGPVLMDFAYATKMDERRVQVHEARYHAIPAYKSINDRYVLLVDDVLDTGVTFKAMQEKLSGMGPKEVLCTSLVWKKGVKGQIMPTNYLSDIIAPADQWIVGMGMDYRGYYRNLDYIGSVDNPHPYEDS